MGFQDLFNDCILGFCDYETPKIIVVKNRTLGIIYRGVQFLVITYFIWYVFISQKAYQESETRPQSSVHTQMRGTAMLGENVLDMVEYVRPSEGGDVISVILRREVTHNQTLGVCAEHYSVPNASCTKHSDCVEGDVDFAGNGRRTGRCVPYYNHTFKTCEIMTWCPIESFAAVSEPALQEAINFTVFIKNTIHFSKFKVLRSNIKPKSMRYLRHCTYNEVTDPYCPVFRLGYIAQQARENFKELCKTGGVIGVFINWKCDFDLDPYDCIPTYSFRRLNLNKNSPLPGYDFRFAKYYHRDGKEFRTLIKAYGIRLDVIVHGHAGKFTLIPTIINMVTAMTSVGICSIICDWVLLTFIDKNEVYSQKKFDEVSTEDAVSSIPMTTTGLTITPYGSNHSDLSEGVAL
ncbi:P2X purinoceptor 2 [Megalops cyprinoides]|uniref:P2X purinoceptor 2 n=1 Tax=Megalops cyprinoides TaxID=118141 RepID=UPI0018655C74|nr:P2X purinoceptor 2 [Megalops cyprinoides]